MDKLIITNNSLVYEKFNREIETVFLDKSSLYQLLECVRDLVYMGHSLYTHPLSGSIKPNETPYKSVVISKKKGVLDVESVAIIEKSMDAALRFMKNYPTPPWTENILKDFRTVDLSLIENAVDRMGNI